MENKKYDQPSGDDLKPVSRKTNEEIDEDNAGNLIIGGETVDENKSVPSDGPVSQDIPKGKNSLTED